jgi:hypothetical protein
VITLVLAKCVYVYGDGFFFFFFDKYMEKDRIIFMENEIFPFHLK